MVMPRTSSGFALGNDGSIQRTGSPTGTRTLDNGSVVGGPMTRTGEKAGSTRNPDAVSQQQAFVDNVAQAAGAGKQPPAGFVPRSAPTVRSSTAESGSSGSGWQAAPAGNQSLFARAAQPQPTNPYLDTDPAKSIANTFDLNKAAGPMQGASGVSVSDNMLASKQLSNILAKDNPLMVQARTRAQEAAAARGLGNSSIAIGAGQAAMNDVALPLAQQDAGTFFDAAKFNASESNNFARDANNFGRQGALQRFGALVDIEGRNQQYGFESFERGQDRDLTRSESALDRNFRRDERLGTQDFQAGESLLERASREEQARLDRQQQSSMQDKDLGFRGEQAGLDRDLTRTENAASRDFTRTEREASQVFEAGENALQRAFQTGERISAQDFSAAQAVLDREQQTRIQQLQEQGMDRRQAESIAAQEREAVAGRIFSAEQAAVDRQFRGEQADADRTLTREENQANRDFSSAEREASQSWQSRENQVGRDFQSSENILDRQFREEQAGLDRDLTRTENQTNRDFQAGQSQVDRDWRGEQAGLDREFQAGQNQAGREFQTSEREASQQFSQLMQTQSQEFQASQQQLQNEFTRSMQQSGLSDQMLGNFTNQMQAQIGSIMADPNMTPEQKTSAMENYYAYANSQMGWMANFFGKSMPDMRTGGMISPTAAPAPGGAPAPVVSPISPAAGQGAPTVTTPATIDRAGGSLVDVMPGTFDRSGYFDRLARNA